MSSGSTLHWLLLGAEGMLGRAIRHTAATRGVTLTAWDQAELDLLAAPTAWPAVPTGVTHVINCAAYTDVDGAESAEPLARRLNGDAVASLSAWCAGADAKLVHISTDYVFDGRGTAPYPVDHPRDPVNAYGRSKAAGEQALLDGPAAFLCVRTAWLYAPWGHNFVRTMRRLMETHDTLQVVDDQRGRPTSAPNLAETIAGLIDRDATGFFHGTDGGETTWFGFAQRIADHVGYTGTLTPCTSDQFQRAAARPGYSVLDLAPTEALLGPRTPWTDALDRVLEQLDRDEPFRADSASQP